MSIKVKVLTAITSIIMSLTASHTAYSHDRGYYNHSGAKIIVRANDRVFYSPVVDQHGYAYYPVHARQFNDRQYLRMQKRLKKKKKIRRLRRLNTTYRLERPVVIVTRPLY